MITTGALKYMQQMGLDPLREVGCAAAKRQPWRMNSPSEQSLEKKSRSPSSVQLAATSTKCP
jgi:hypothetical protein